MSLFGEICHAHLGSRQIYGESFPGCQQVKHYFGSCDFSGKEFFFFLLYVVNFSGWSLCLIMRKGVGNPLLLLL